jgi:hypothetical protein
LVQLPRARAKWKPSALPQLPDHTAALDRIQFLLGRQRRGAGVLVEIAASYCNRRSQCTAGLCVFEVLLLKAIVQTTASSAPASNRIHVAEGQRIVIRCASTTLLREQTGSSDAYVTKMIICRAAFITKVDTLKRACLEYQTESSPNPNSSVDEVLIRCTCTNAPLVRWSFEHAFSCS